MELEGLHGASGQVPYEPLLKEVDAEVGQTGDTPANTEIFGARPSDQVQVSYVEFPAGQKLGQWHSVEEAFHPFFPPHRGMITHGANQDPVRELGMQAAHATGMCAENGELFVTDAGNLYFLEHISGEKGATQIDLASPGQVEIVRT